MVSQSDLTALEAPILDYLAAAKAAVMAKVGNDGKQDRTLVDEEQRAPHGLAWINSLCAAIRHSLSRGLRQSEVGRFGEVERLALAIGLGEYLAQVTSGIPMSQMETLHPTDLGIEEAGYAQEYEISRVFCDARIPNILEGAAAIQAQVIGHGHLNS